MHMYHSSSYYSILGVVPTATAKEIRTKYMQLARALHPDKNSSQEAQTKLQAINEAWAVLKNKSTRTLYDRDGKEGLPDSIISTDDEDDDDNDADDRSATKLPHVYSFFGSATQAPADDADWELPVAMPASHAPSRAAALRSSSATSVSTSASGSVSGCGSTRAPDATLTLQIAEAVAEAIRRTEAAAAARYQRALTSVLQTLEPTLAAEQAQERARHAWEGAGRMWEQDPP